MNTLLLRPVRADELPLLNGWLGRSTTLPQKPGEHLWVAVSSAGEPLACLRLVPAIGMRTPRVSYHVGCVVHAAPELALFHRQRTLLLGHDLTGATELADLGCAPDTPAQRQATALRALVYAAVAQIGADRALHGDRLVAELPGPRGDDGRSPFWEGLGRRFYAGDPLAALAEHGLDWRTHVAALLPRHPLLASFLPDAAQDAIGQVRTDALPWRQQLLEAGLRHAQHINVEDGGPILEAEIDDLLAQRSMRA